MAQSPPRITGWDPWLLISQIVSIQSFHYLMLCMLMPPILTTFSEPNALEYEGGTLQVAAIMDWREMSSRPTVNEVNGSGDRGWAASINSYSEGKNVSVGSYFGEEGGIIWNGRIDPIRGRCIAVAWLLASMADVYYLYIFVRKPRLILDFSLTLVLNHLILTTYYSAALPSSMFFWFIVISGACLTIISAEQLCVRREMREGLGIGPWNAGSVNGNVRVEESDAMELAEIEVL